MTPRVLALLALAAVTAWATPPAATAPFTLPELPYEASALEPHFDARTMDLHRTRHHKAQVDALNAAVAQNPALAGLSLEALLARAGSLGPAVRNNAGGHYNHSLFWQNLAPAGKGGVPSAALLARIQADFGSLEALQKALSAAAMGRFGSGWAWLVVTPGGKLAVTSTPNQDNPLMDVAEVKGIPVLGLDVWEHAYYLAYQNRRADFISAWWKVVNWQDASARFEAATAKSARN